jgi:hypothetical protein
VVLLLTYAPSGTVALRLISSSYTREKRSRTRQKVGGGGGGGGKLKLKRKYVKKKFLE